MGKKPADRAGQKTAPQGAVQGAVQGFESTVPCGCCGAASRAVRHRQWRACANGHTFVKKSDQ
jgi:hypothetical protein